ncbi:MAG TPA: hypothetical protein VHE09_00770 [Rhizomicrobium sp.]|jgi:hypothetical protein|nr:hypothetical protein [Rhizomicrobium sp.]
MRHILFPISIALFCATSAAQAQQIGEYDGLTSDGSTVYIQVAQDPNNSNLEVKVVSFGLSMDCLKSGETLNDIGIGLGDGQDIIDGKFSYSTQNFFYIDLVTSMTFKGDNKIKGTVGGNLSAFNPASGHDTLIKNVQACTSPKQSFTATFSGPAKYTIPAGTVQVAHRPAAGH